MQFQKVKSYITARLQAELPNTLPYHSISHVLDVYESAKRIGMAEGLSGDNLKMLLTAALFHDSGFMQGGKNHELAGCLIARDCLPDFNYSAQQIDRICSMIMATSIPQMPGNLSEEILADADLDYLGRDDFWTIGNKLFEELKLSGVVTTLADWNALQIRFLEQHHYFTETSIRTRKAQKEAHLALLKANP